MSKEIFNGKYKNLHFVGVGGVSMSGLAEYALDLNLGVSGSDLTKNDKIYSLIERGAKIFVGHRKSNVNGADALIVTSAVDKDNAEVTRAKELGLPIFDRAKVLGEVLDGYKNSVAVSGSHGKTTATAMITKVLIDAGKDPTAFLGGESQDVKNYRRGFSDYAVAEACEYKKNMLFVKPKISVVLNIDNDHLDSYGSLENQITAFKQFIDGRLAVINADDFNSKTLFNSSTVTFGIDSLATYTARNLKYNGNGYTFTAYAYSRKIERIKLSVKGRHNVYNALATFAVADLLGINSKTVKTALESFTGVSRRMEYIGDYKGLKCYADYAHHPREIKATLSAVKDSGENPLVVFQPHTYSRTRILTEEFVDALIDQKGCAIYKTYPAREKYDLSGDAKTLAEIINIKGGNCFYLNTPERLLEYLSKNLNEKTCILFLGAGDIYQIARNCI